MSLYLEGESEASLIIDAPLSYEVGQPFCSSKGYISENSGESQELRFDIVKVDTEEILVHNVSVPVNSTKNEFSFPLSSFNSSFTPYDILIKTISAPCSTNIEAVTQLRVLPSRNDSGSVVKVDYLYGGISTFYSSLNSSTSWKYIFPYSYYVSWGGYLKGSESNLKSFADYGFNIIHPIPGGSQTEPFDEPEFTEFLDTLDEMGLWLMYDMRWTYKNATALTSQVEALKSRKSLLLWYTADEPDGQGDPLDAPSQAHTTLKSLDPYHPVSLVLNCHNFHFAAYSAGADILLTDPYPIGTNLTFSTQWHTPCNLTYGDCGCDACAAPALSNIPARLDAFALYQTWLARPGARPPPPLWAVPQAFGAAEYWARVPTAAEEVAMAALAVNHAAKGLVAWMWPAADELADVTGRLAGVLASERVVGFLLGARPACLRVAGPQESEIDAAGWRVGAKMLLSVVSMSYDAYAGSVTLELPAAADKVEVLWPVGADSASWVANGDKITKSALSALEVSLLLIDLE